MSTDKGDEGQAKTSTPSEVGYRRPPTQHRFKKGASGNPGGRPKKTARPKPASSTPLVADYILHEAYRIINLRENDQPIQMPLIQAVIRSLGVAALKGNHRAQVAMAGFVRDAEQGRIDERIANVQAFLEYKLTWSEELKSRERAEEPPPELPVHPDEIVIDGRTGEIIINGPFDDAEKAKWAEFERLKEDHIVEIQASKKLLKKMPNHREFIENDVAHSQWLIDLVDRTFPSETVRRAPGFNIHQWRAKQLRIHEALGKTKRPHFRIRAARSKKELSK